MPIVKLSWGNMRLERTETILLLKELICFSYVQSTAVSFEKIIAELLYF